MTISIFRRPNEDRTRRLKTTRIHLALEGLEQRTVLSHMAPIPHPPADMGGMGNHDHGKHDGGGLAKHAERLTISNFVVNNVALNNGQLVANATISGAVKHHAFSKQVAIPVTLSATPAVSPSAASVSPAAAPALSILHLTLGPVNLSLLGLNVHLGADCSFTSTAPITADIVAIPTGSTYHSPITNMDYKGGLLGDVLSGVANLLNGGTGLGGLTSTTLAGLESGLTQILNGLLQPAAGVTGGSLGGMAPAAAPGSSEVLELPLGPISLDLLGAFVQTSPICLNVTATRGPGNLLGNLLG